MTGQQFKTIDVLRLEVEDRTPPGLVNLLKNPDGRLGTYYWSTINASLVRSTATVSGATVDVLLATAVVTNSLTSAGTRNLPVTAGQWLAASYIAGGDAGQNAFAVEWRNSLNNVIGSQVLGTVYAQSDTTRRTFAAIQAPAGTVSATIGVVMFTSGGANAVAGQKMTLRDVTVAKASTAAALAGLGYIDPVQYRNILSSATTVSIERDDLNVGTLTSTIIDATLDPSDEDIIRPGRLVRCLALNAGTGQWESIFDGKISKGSVVYQPARQTNDRARITLEAVDNVSVLAQIGQPSGVATIGALPYLFGQVAAAAVRWIVNSSRAALATASVVTSTDGATLLDQILITRDTALGYAWVDRTGRIQAWDRNTIPATVKASLTDADYNADAAIGFDTEDLINEVTIVFRRRNAANDETVEINYGPYRDADSIAEWGVRGKTFTIQGAVDDPVVISNYAQIILAANATPRIRTTALTVPVRLAADISSSRALLDLYDLVEVTQPGASVAEQLRIRSIKHAITSGPTSAECKWLVSLGFGDTGSVAVPQQAPALPSQQTLATGWQTLTHSGTGGTLRYQVLHGVVYVEGGVTITIASGATVTVLAAANALPASARPTLAIWSGARVNAGTLAGHVLRNLDGTIQATQATGAGATSISFAYSYPLG